MDPTTTTTPTSPADATPHGVALRLRKRVENFLQRMDHSMSSQQELWLKALNSDVEEMCAALRLTSEEEKKREKELEKEWKKRAKTPQGEAQAAAMAARHNQEACQRLRREIESFATLHKDYVENLIAHFSAELQKCQQMVLSAISAVLYAELEQKNKDDKAMAHMTHGERELFTKKWNEQKREQETKLEQFTNNMLHVVVSAAERTAQWMKEAAAERQLLLQFLQKQAAEEKKQKALEKDQKKTESHHLAAQREKELVEMLQMVRKELTSSHRTFENETQHQAQAQQEEKQKRGKEEEAEAERWRKVVEAAETSARELAEARVKAKRRSKVRRLEQRATMEKEREQVKKLAKLTKEVRDMEVGSDGDTEKENVDSSSSSSFKDIPSLLYSHPPPSSKEGSTTAPPSRDDQESLLKSSHNTKAFFSGSEDERGRGRESESDGSPEAAKQLWRMRRKEKEQRKREKEREKVEKEKEKEKVEKEKEKEREHERRKRIQEREREQIRVAEEEQKRKRAQDRRELHHAIEVTRRALEEMRAKREGTQKEEADLLDRQCKGLRELLHTHTMKLKELQEVVLPKATAELERLQKERRTVMRDSRETMNALIEDKQQHISEMTMLVRRMKAAIEGTQERLLTLEAKENAALEEEEAHREAMQKRMRERERMMAAESDAIMTRVEHHTKVSNELAEEAARSQAEQQAELVQWQEECLKLQQRLKDVSRKRSHARVEAQRRMDRLALETSVRKANMYASMARPVLDHMSSSPSSSTSSSLFSSSSSSSSSPSSSPLQAAAQKKPHRKHPAPPREPRGSFLVLPPSRVRPPVRQYAATKGMGVEVKQLDAVLDKMDHEQRAEDSVHAQRRRLAEDAERRQLLLQQYKKQSRTPSDARTSSTPSPPLLPSPSTSAQWNTYLAETYPFTGPANPTTALPPGSFPPVRATKYVTATAGSNGNSPFDGKGAGGRQSMSRSIPPPPPSTPASAAVASSPVPRSQSGSPPSPMGTTTAIVGSRVPPNTPIDFFLTPLSTTPLYSPFVPPFTLPKVSNPSASTQLNHSHPYAVPGNPHQSPLLSLPSGVTPATYTSSSSTKKNTSAGGSRSKMHASHSKTGNEKQLPRGKMESKVKSESILPYV